MVGLIGILFFDMYPVYAEKTAEEYFQSGIAARKQGNITQAIADYSKAIEINPDFAWAYFYRADAYAVQGNFSQAATDENKVKEIRTKEAYASRDVYIYAPQDNFVSSAESGKGQGVIENLDFKDADVKTVIQAIAQKAVKGGQKVNILVSSGVNGKVTVDLKNIDWQSALIAVLKTFKQPNNYVYGCMWNGENSVLVDTMDNLSGIQVPEVSVISTLKTISIAMENYAVAHNGRYPFDVVDLTKEFPPYLSSNYAKTVPPDYSIACSGLGGTGYRCVARVNPDSVYAKKMTDYVATTGGNLTPAHPYQTIYPVKGD